MKVLLDSCLSAGASEVVAAAGHDVEWSGNWPSDPGDEQILQTATEQQRVLVTLDKDFGELAIVKDRVRHGLIRLVGFRAREQGKAIVDLLSLYGDELSQGAVVTAEPWRVRVRSVRNE